MLDSNAPVMVDNIPDKIGKYTIINEVGRGSTGTVYLSHDPYYGRDVAIKLYNHEAEQDSSSARVARKMFFNEAHMVGMLQHPNILPIYDAGEEDGRYYVVMEHIHGARTLSAYCRPDNLLPLNEVVELVFKCAKALHYAHTRGVVHRDIKPGNIMLTVDNDIRIVDFGIAILRDADISRIDGIAGSPSYMSPEQIQSEEITARTDIYAIGTVAYELLTGHRPFKASNLAKLMHKILYATPEPIHKHRSDVPEDLEEVVTRAVRKRPDERWDNGLELGAALTRVHQGLRRRYGVIDERERLTLLRGLSFFHEFSHGEIRELLRAGEWREYGAGENIVKEGEMDDRFFVLLHGDVDVVSHGETVGRLSRGGCFGESSYVATARRAATIRSVSDVTLLAMTSTMLETLSMSCQLRFNQMFLRSLIRRLHQSPPAE
jgi:hypothetical protein